MGVVTNIDGRPMAEDVEVIALVGIGKCRDIVGTGELALVLSNVLRVDVVIDGREYVLVVFRKPRDFNVDRAPWVSTSVVVN